eukprot:1142309-Pelagomonas_calceolata.AAC.2
MGLLVCRVPDPGYGQYRHPHPHPGGLCGDWSRHLEAVCTVHRVVVVRLLVGTRPRIFKGSQN